MVSMEAHNRYMSTAMLATNLKLSFVCMQEDEVEDVKGLSGDEVDPNLIIAGGRRSRRGRAQFGSGSKYQYQAKNGDGDDDEDEW